MLIYLANQMKLYLPRCLLTFNKQCKISIAIIVEGYNFLFMYSFSKTMTLEKIIYINFIYTVSIYNMASYILNTVCNYKLHIFLISCSQRVLLYWCFPYCCGLILIVARLLVNLFYFFKELLITLYDAFFITLKPVFWCSLMCLFKAVYLHSRAGWLLIDMYEQLTDASKMLISV